MYLGENKWSLHNFGTEWLNKKIQHDFRKYCRSRDFDEQNWPKLNSVYYFAVNHEENPLCGLFIARKYIKLDLSPRSMASAALCVKS